MDRRLTNLSFEENRTLDSFVSEGYKSLPRLTFERINTTTEIEDSAMNKITKANNTVLHSARQNFAANMTTFALEEIDDFHLFTADFTTLAYNDWENIHVFTAKIPTTVHEEMEDFFLNSTFTTATSTNKMIRVTEQDNITSEFMTNFTTTNLENAEKKKESDYMFYYIAIAPIAFLFLLYLCFLMCYIRRRYLCRINSRIMQDMLPISA